MIKILYFTDPHIRGSNPVSRLDNFPLTIINKINWVIQFAAAQKCNIILCGGDFFDRPDISFSVLHSVTPVLKSSSIPIYTILGNHDIYGYNPKTLIRSALSILNFTDIIKVIDEKLILQTNTEKVIIKATHSYYDLDKQHTKENDYLINPYKDLSKDSPITAINVVHGFLTNVKWPECVNYTLIDEIIDTEFDIILSGHEHSGFGVVCKNNKIFCNPGALARLSASIGDINLEVKVALITIDGNNRNIELIHLPNTIALPAEEVIDRKRIEEEKQQQKQLMNFMQNISDFRMESFNLYHALDIFAQKYNVESKIIELARNFLTEAELELKQNNE